MHIQIGPFQTGKFETTYLPFCELNKWMQSNLFLNQRGLPSIYSKIEFYKYKMQIIFCRHCFPQMVQGKFMVSRLLKENSILSAFLLYLWCRQEPGVDDNFISRFSMQPTPNFLLNKCFGQNAFPISLQRTPLRLWDSVENR